MSVLRFLTALTKSGASYKGPLNFLPYGQLKYKKNEGGWFGTLEGKPSFDVDSIFNHFLRFTVVDGAVTFTSV